MSEGIYVPVQWTYHKIIHLALDLRLQQDHSITKHNNKKKKNIFFLTNALQRNA